jgi:hypothetical protein
MRVLISHDISTVPPLPRKRVVDGKVMPGVFLVSDRMPIGRAIDELQFLSEDADPDEWQNEVIHLPI